MSTALMQDKSGNFWFVSKNNGVFRFDGKLFTNFTEKDGLSSNFVFCILEDNDGLLWFGTADGITCYDGKKFTIIPITTISGNSSYRKTTTDNYGVPNPQENFVQGMLLDKTGILWIGTGGAVYRYNGNNYTEFSTNNNVVNASNIQIKGIETFLQDSAGNIWMGGRGSAGLFRFDGKSVTHFKLDEEMWVRPLLEDKTGTLWFGSPRKMVYRYDGKNFTHFGKDEIKDWVFYMAEDKTGNLWYSNGFSGGVTRYDGEINKFFTKQEGLCYDSIWCITVDREGNTWFMNRDKNLCKYDGKTFTHFSE